jgi:heterodisulfide reductase subunit A-like polyferredoxin/coenzyme F420-reducing hydrogenase delta subunit
MKEQRPNVLIIGGGVAGMSAALTIADQDILVHIVEKENNLGGHAAKWSCMATDTCQNCGACLSIEMAEQIYKHNNLILHLNTLLNRIEKTDRGYEVELENKDAFFVQKIIVATGFSPCKPGPSLKHDCLPNVITTAELNTHLKEQTLSALLQNKKNPKIAFIQCVGSRNRQQGRDYCSQVCCKISMRHATKLIHLYPESKISLFYMDLQIIGKEVRSFYKKLSEKVSLIQGVPTEILKNTETGQASVVTEDSDNKTRKISAFDLIVLSVGMQPAKNLDKTCTALNLTPNNWGFFNTDNAISSEDIIIAGCAKGPADILSSRQDGCMAAAEVMKRLGLIRKPEDLSVAVLGDSADADKTAELIAQKGYKVFLFGQGSGLKTDSSVTNMKDCRLKVISGTAKNFTINFESGGKNQQINCSAIIAAPAPLRYQKTPGKVHDQLMSLNQYAGLAETAPEKTPDNAVILLDYFGPEFKTNSRSALKAALKAKASGKTISIIMNNMLVHGHLGQQLYDIARKQGIDFYRYQNPEDIQIQSQDPDSDKGLKISLKDASLPSLNLNIPCEALILPESYSPDKDFAYIAALLKQSLDNEGFLQSANTRHRLIGSPRKGIYFSGICHDDIDADDFDREVQEILSSINILNSGQALAEPVVEINQQKCAQCLTCIRICPHGAIVMNNRNRPQIVAEACFACHLCVSNCPAYAIESKTMSNEHLAGAIRKDSIIILACERSAALAAKNLKLPDSVQVICVPCACRISPDLIMKALLNGAKKVIISGCHPENCQSLEGSKTAEYSVKKILSIPGMDQSRLLWKPVAANEPEEFGKLYFKV